MKHTFLYICIFALLLVLVATPVNAFTIKNLEIISPDSSTDARINIDYTLNFIEGTAVFAQIVDPSEQLKTAIESNTGKTVTGIIMSDGHIECTIKDFLYQEGRVTTVPTLTFSRAEEILRSYWFSGLLTVDLSPDITTIVFSDGFKVPYYDTLIIPETAHQLI
jgi:hypothetical protein